MRVSQAFIPTVKETPQEAEIPSHKLMLRAGLMRKVASGIYEYLPLGQRVLIKIIGIIRQEMERGVHVRARVRGEIDGGNVAHVALGGAEMHGDNGGRIAWPAVHAVGERN